MNCKHGMPTGCCRHCAADRYQSQMEPGAPHIGQTHYGLTIGDQFVLHSTAARDYLCGTCGSRLVTRYVDARWMTVCYDNPEHDEQGFVHNGVWWRRESERAAEAHAAGEVLRHLPPELQAELERRE